MESRVQPSGSEVAAGVRAGDVLAGKYLVDRVLGVGAMGIVVAAHHLQLDTKVAIKFMLPHMLSGGEAVGRFAREAKAAAKIASEHVARVLDVGTLETGAPYMVMEFLEGSDLRECLQQRGPMAVPQAIDFLLQACEAIAEAHALGIVHRDLKPANMFVIRRPDGSDCVKVLDFGISKIANVGGSAPDMAMTKTTATMGTPLYMSPEQMESSRSVDGRTDIWALGVILFELLTGGVPFDGQTLPEVCVKIATYTPPSVRSLRPDVPVAVEAVIYKCLEKDRNKRYANMAELAAALLPVAPPHARLSAERITRMGGRVSPAYASASPNVIGAPAMAGAGTVAPLGSTTASATRSRAVVGVAGAALAAAAFGAFVFVNRASATHSVAATSAVAASPAPASPTPDPPAASSTAHVELGPPPVAPVVASAPAAEVAAVPVPVESDPHSSHGSKTAAPPRVPSKPAKAVPTPGTAPAGVPVTAAVANAAPSAPQAPLPPEPSPPKKTSSAFDDRQ